MDNLEEVKSKIDIVAFISEQVPLNKAGRNFKGLCPFHAEKTPSFVVSPERQIWHCFGCQKGGDIFRFLMEKEKMEFGEALQVLAKRAGVKLQQYAPSSIEKSKERLFAANHLAAEFYHHLLLNHPSGKKALDYLLGRGITTISMKKFKLGYAPNLRDALGQFLRKKGFVEAEILAAGLGFKSQNRGVRDLFAGRVMFPLIDQKERVIGFAGRALPGTGQEPKYFNTFETPIFHKGSFLYGLNVTREAIRKANTAILVEGEIDLIASYQAGAENVAAVKGTALTEEQVQLLKRYAENVSICFDADLAGDTAAKRGIHLAEAAGLDIKIIQLIEGKDPDECVRCDAKIWQASIEKAVPIYDYYLTSAVSRFDVKSAEGKRKIGQEIVPILAKLQDDILRAHYVKKLAGILAVGEESVWQAIEKQDGKGETGLLNTGTAVEIKSTAKSRLERLEEYYLALLLHFLPLAGAEKEKKVWGDLGEKTFECSPYDRIFGIIRQYLTTCDKFSIVELTKQLPPELLEIVDRLYLYDLDSLDENEEKLRKELVSTALEIKKLFLKRRLKTLASQVTSAQDEHSEEKLDALNLKFSQISAKLEQLNHEG